MIKYEDLLGIKYKAYGRDRTGLDCYGLAIEVLNRMGFKLDDLYKKGGFVEKLPSVDEGDYSDIVLFFDNKGRTVHIGVCLDKERFIHCDILGVRISYFKNYGLSRRFHRWQS